MHGSIGWGRAQNHSEGFGVIGMTLIVWQSNSQSRIVSMDCSRTHQHCIAVGPESMSVESSFFASDPLRGTVSRCGSTVERRGQFKNNERSTGAAVMKIRSKLLRNLVCATTNRNFDTGFAQKSYACSCDIRIGIGDTNDNFRDARSDDRFSARRRASVVRARFERHIER